MSCNNLEHLRLTMTIIIIIIIIIIIVALCLWCCHHGKAIVRVHPVHLMNVERRQAAADPQTKPADLLDSTSTIASYNNYSARKQLVLIYRPTEHRRLSRPGWLVTYRYGLPTHRQDRAIFTMADQ